MSWEIFKLKDITVNLDNKRKPLNESERSKISKKQLYPYLGANNIMGYVDEYLFDEEIICIAEDGGSWGENQKCCVFVNEKCWVNNHAHVLKSNGKADLKYLMYYLNSKDLNSYITGSTRGKLTKSSLNSIGIPLPPLATQKRIAEILDAADALRRKDQELLKKYDELAQAIFIDMFGDPTLNSKKFKIKTLGELIINKSDLVDGPFGSSVNVKTDYVKDGEIPVVRTKNIGLLEFYEKDLMFMTREKFETVKRSQVLPGDIIITKVGTIGNISFFPSHLKEGVLSTTGSCRFRPTKDVINPTFLSYNLLYQRGYMKRISAEGVQPFLNMTHIKSIPVLYPDINQQNLFERRIKKLEETVFGSKTSAEHASSLFNALSRTFFS